MQRLPDLRQVRTCEKWSPRGTLQHGAVCQENSERSCDNGFGVRQRDIATSLQPGLLRESSAARRGSMDFEITEEQAGLRDSVRAVLGRECPTSLAREVVEKGSVPEQPWKSAGELGWTAIAIPESVGCLGLSFEELGFVIEEHGRVLAPGPFLASVTQFAPLVCEAGTPEQWGRFLKPIAAGEATGALALASSTGRGLSPDDGLRARRDGEAYLLDGARHFVLDGESADEIAVVARVDEGDGIGLFVLPQGAAKAERFTSFDASRPLVTLRFDQVRVGPERTLGKPGACQAALARALDQATVALALENVGVCQTLLDLSVEAVISRLNRSRLFMRGMICL